MSPYIPLALLVSHSRSQWSRMFAETPFAGIHHLAWFDWAMLIPYFSVLIVLSVYGIHRYDIIRTYFKHRKRPPKSPPNGSSNTSRQSPFSCRFTTSATWWSA